MSKSKSKTSLKKKNVKVVSTVPDKTSNAVDDTVKKTIAPTKSRRTNTTQTISNDPLIFGKQNYLIMGAGLVCITLGLILMSGGSMPSPDVWDESIIYGFRRTVLAPILMLIGLVLEVVAIFKR